MLFTPLWGLWWTALSCNPRNGGLYVLGRAVFGLPSIRYRFPGLHNHAISQSSQTVIFFSSKAFVFFLLGQMFLEKCVFKCVQLSHLVFNGSSYDGAKLVRVMWNRLTPKCQGGSIWSILKCFF
jgi:hypothetical protein